MSMARRERFEVVRTGLRIIGWSLAAGAGLTVVNRVFMALAFESTRPRTSIDYAMIGVATFALRAGFLAIAVTLAVGATRLGELPPIERAVLKGAGYRASPSVTSEERYRGLGRAIGISAWLAVAVEVGSMLLGWLGSVLLTSGPAGLVVHNAVWLVSLVVLAGAYSMLALWMIGVARSLSLRIPEPLAIAAVVLVGLRTAFFVIRTAADLKLPGWAGWPVTATWIAVDVALMVVAFGLARGLASLPDEPPPAGEPSAAPAEDSHWGEAGEGLGRYASALKARIVLILVGAGLILMGGLSGSRGLVQLVAVALPLGALVLGIVMMVALARYARVPADTRAGGPAVVAIVLFALASVADLYDLSLVSALVGEGGSTRRQAMEHMPYVESAAQVLGVLGLLALLASFTRLATSMGEGALASRARSLNVLLVILGSGAIAFRLLAGEMRGLGAAVLAAPVVLVVALVALSRYVRLIDDLRLAMVRRSG